MTKHTDLSRRSFLGTAAASSLLVACGDDPPPSPTADVMTLNALLTAEYRAVKAYEAGLTVLRSPPMGDPLTVLARDLTRIALRWQSQHRDHASALAAAIGGNYGTPVVESSVMFALPDMFPATITNVLKLAFNEERAAALAYNDAVKAMGGTNNRFLAGSIEGDETQHVIILQSLLLGVAGAGSTILDMDVVPRSFVSTVSAGTNPNGLQAAPSLDLPYGA